jgi:hypothetical protein
VARDDTRGDGLGSSDFRIEQDGSSLGGQGGGNVQLEARELSIVVKGWIGLAQVLPVVERQRGNGAAAGGNLLQAPVFSGG